MISSREKAAPFSSRYPPHPLAGGAARSSRSHQQPGSLRRSPNSGAERGALSRAEPAPPHGRSGSWQRPADSSPLMREPRGAPRPRFQPSLIRLGWGWCGDERRALPAPPATHHASASPRILRQKAQASGSTSPPAFVKYEELRKAGHSKQHQVSFGAFFKLTSGLVSSRQRVSLPNPKLFLHPLVVRHFLQNTSDTPTATKKINWKNRAFPPSGFMIFVPYMPFLELPSHSSTWEPSSPKVNLSTHSSDANWITTDCSCKKLKTAWSLTSQNETTDCQSLGICEPSIVGPQK